MGESGKTFYANTSSRDEAKWVIQWAYPNDILKKKSDKNSLSWERPRTGFLKCRCNANGDGNEFLPFWKYMWGFGGLGSGRHHCRVCGAQICKNCCDADFYEQHSKWQCDAQDYARLY